MHKGVKYAIILLLSVLAAQPLLADTFIVTSPQDNGPGSLRVALQQAAANGTSVKDSIRFNIPNINGPFGVIIGIRSRLPFLSSNLVIDGNSQPGSDLRDGSGKVIITPKTPESIKVGFVLLDVQDVEIYGLYLRGFSYAMDDNDWFCDAIYMNNVQNITIGRGPTTADPLNRGNIFGANLRAIRHDRRDHLDTATFFAKNIAISANLIGEDPAAGTGGGGRVPDPDTGIVLINTMHVLVGGPDTSWGNRFTVAKAGLHFILLATGRNDTAKRSSILNNSFLKLDIAIPPRNPATVAPTAFYIEQNGTTPADTIAFEGNTVRRAMRGLILQSLGSPFTFHRNTVEVQMDPNFSGNSIGVLVLSCTAGGNAGSFGPLEIPNYISGAHGIDAPGIGVFGGSGPVLISKNSIFCNDLGIQAVGPAVPTLRINQLRADGAAGTTCANCTVEVFQTYTCNTDVYNGEQYFKTVVADAAGNWVYNDSLYCNTTFTSTSPAKSTSRFYSIYDFMINLAGLRIRPATCGRNNGSVTGLRIPVTGCSIRWEDDAGNIVGTDTSLVNVPAGRYRAVVRFDARGCEKETAYFTVRNFDAPVFDLSLVEVKPPSACGPRGSIQFIGIINNNPLPFPIHRFEWKNQNGVVVGNTLNLTNLPPGTYTLTGYVIIDTTCKTVAGPFVLNEIPRPVLDLSNVRVGNDSCDAAKGRISGARIINPYGLERWVWEDLNGNVAGFGPNVTGLRKGRYRLRYKDDNQCDTLYSPYYFIDNVGEINIDEANKLVKAATCFGPDGSISGISVSGATAFNWINTATNAAAGSTLNISNLAAGSYQLTARNNFGCSKQITVIVPQTVFTSPIAVNNVQYQHAYCDSATGTIRVQNFNNDNPAFFQFSWQDAAGNAAGTGLALNNIVPGDYQLIARDTNGCTKNIFTATLLSSKAPVIDETILLLTHDTCTLGNGSIRGLSISNGTAPFAYQWRNAAGQPLGTQPTLDRLLAGSYRLRVTDNLGCAVQSRLFVVEDKSKLILPPGYDTLIVTGRGMRARLNLQTTARGLYELYQLPNLTTPVQQNSTGIFVTQNLPVDAAFAIRSAEGSCFSDFTRVYVKVVDKTEIYVPTGFSPNGDKKNDVLKPIVIGPVTLTQFAVYNRWGQLVFLSKDANRGWDGTLNGAEQPAGTYVWMITGYDLYNRPITQRGVTTLIR
jgi:gliding motility-associated-like protein